MRFPLKVAFGLGFVVALLGSALMPGVRLMAFAPFLALVYTRRPFVRALWLAALCGLVMDLMSCQLRFGLYALNYCLTTLLLYSQKRHFFDDKPLSLPLYTFFVSGAASLIEFGLIAVFHKSLSLDGKTAFTELLMMPLADALYAFLWFTCPIRLTQHVQRVGWRAALGIKKDEEEESA